MKRRRDLLKKQFRDKKKIPIRKRIQDKQLRKRMISNTNFIGSQKKKISANRFQLKRFWHAPVIVFIATLIVIIVIIPTLIVIPFIKEDNGQAIPTEKEVEEPVVEETESPFSVAVMRSVSEEVESVPLETYVARVVASEMPAEFETEALKAQALAARTYIVNHLMHTDDNMDSDVTDTTRHQVYQNESELRKQWGSDYDWKMDKIQEAVSATSGEILTHNDTPITPAFFSTSNGYTENSEDYWKNELPYLRSVKSNWDTASPKYLDQKVFSVEKVEAALEIDLPVSMPVDAQITRTESGRVEALMLADHELTGRTVREKLGLQSSDFSIEQKNNHFVFTTKGFGHGVGMSQYGANGMAQEGKTYQEIVKYYYKGIEVSKVGEVAPTLVAK